MKKIIAILLVLGIIVAIVFSYFSYEKINEKIEKRGGRKILAIRYTIHNVIITMNIFLLLSLLLLYLDSYSKTKSSFMLGLVFFIGILLIQAILSLPIINAIFGFPYLFSLPYVFEMFALFILLILSLE